MSLLFPLGIQYRRENSPSGEAQWSNTRYLFVNPTDIQINKTPSIAETRTMGGTVFQPWVNQPDEVIFRGVMYGTRSIADFKTLQGTVDGKPHLREVRLVYKWRMHPGFVKSMAISASSEKPRMFNYEFTFTSKKAFSLVRLMLGQTTGLRTEADFVSTQFSGLRSALRTMSKDPLALALGAVTVSQAATAFAGGFNPNNIAKDLADQQSMMNSEPEDDSFLDGKLGQWTKSKI